MVKCAARNLSAWFGARPALRNLSLDVQANEILSIIGPANSGKTTFLRQLNRLNELTPHFRAEGEATLDGTDVRRIDAEELRRRVGMVFALPAPLPLSIFDNVAYGVRMRRRLPASRLAAVVESALRQAFLWEEVQDRLGASAFHLSGGQQQRLCIARTLAVEPEVVLFDEPCSGLDPISTAKVEDTMVLLKKKYTIVLVTNNVKQASRVGDRTAFFLMGELVEIAETRKLFTAPSDRRTEDYLSGKFG
jgi:phosphate transport system ATP-binding protein